MTHLRNIGNLFNLMHIIEFTACFDTCKEFGITFYNLSLLKGNSDWHLTSIFLLCFFLTI